MMNWQPHPPGGDPGPGPLQLNSGCKACTGKGSMVFGPMKRKSGSDEEIQAPHEKLAIWGFLNTQICLEICLIYYQRSHKPEYALSQTPDNLLFEPDPYPDKDALVKAWYEENERFVAAVMNGTATEIPGPGPEHWDTKSLDRWFVRNMEAFYEIIYENHQGGRENYCTVEAIKRMTYLLDWLKNELAPENWEASILPDLLLIRAKEGGYEAEREAEETHEHCDEYVVLVDGEEVYHPIVDKPFLLMENGSTLIDETGFPPGHPIPNMQKSPDQDA